MTEKYTWRFDIYFITILRHLPSQKQNAFRPISLFVCYITRYFSQIYTVISSGIISHIVTRIQSVLIHCDANTSSVCYSWNVRVSLCSFASSVSRAAIMRNEWRRKRSSSGAIPSKGILLTVDETDSADKSWRAILFGRYIELDGTRNTSAQLYRPAFQMHARDAVLLTAIVVSARAIRSEK